MNYHEKSYSVMLVNRHWHGINPLICGHEDCDPGHFFGPASRTHYLLHYVLSGKGCFTSHGERHELKAGQMFVIRPGEITYYRADEEDPWRYIWVGFDADIPLPEQLSEDVLTVPWAESVFLSMEECDEPEQGREDLLCSKIWSFFSRLRESNPRAQSRADEYVMQAVNIIETGYYRQDVTVAGLSRSLGLDRSYFSTIFKKKTGKSPVQYLIDIRLETSVELMYGKGFSVGEAAAAVGYSDIFNFSRSFKKKYGVSPAAYGRKNGKAEKQR